jgi:hypothetical protein
LVEEQRMGQRLRQAVKSIAFIAEHIRAEMSDKKVSRELIWPLRKEGVMWLDLP